MLRIKYIFFIILASSNLLLASDVKEEKKEQVECKFNPALDGWYDKNFKECVSKKQLKDK